MDGWLSVVSRITSLSPFLGTYLAQLEYYCFEDNTLALRWPEAYEKEYYELVLRGRNKEVIKGSLKKQGYKYTVIVILKDSCVTVWTPSQQQASQPINKTKKANAKQQPTYKDLLRYPEWQKKKNEIYAERGWACESCGATKRPFHVHHLRYAASRLPWDVPNSDLELLCDVCHSAEHKLDMKFIDDASEEFITNIPRFPFPDMKARAVFYAHVYIHALKQLNYSLGIHMEEEKAEAVIYPRLLQLGGVREMTQGLLNEKTKTQAVYLDPVTAEQLIV